MLFPTRAPRKRGNLHNLGSGCAAICATILHRRERGNGVVGAGWRLELHVVGIVDEIVIWDKFVINGLTFLVYNRVGVHSCRRLGSC